MTDVQNGNGSTEIRRIDASARYVGWMINIISVIAGIISIVVVVSVVIIAISGGIVPSVLADWGGIILGFYFGQFISLVNGYIGIQQRDAK